MFYRRNYNIGDMRFPKKPLAYGISSLVIPCLLVLAFCGNVSSVPEGLGALLPDRVGIWAKHEAGLFYAGDELFTYINGGAEIYHEFGFDKVAVQDYKSPEGGTISLEIYEMSDPESAYGIYTFKRSPQGKALEVPGGEARQEDYYVNLWKGRFLVTLTGFDQAETTIRGLEALLRDVASRITDTSEVPELVKRLPEAQLIEGSVKYFMGPLALFNSHRFSAENLLGPERGVRGDYEGGDSLFIFRYEAPETLREIFQNVEAHFDANPDPNIAVKLAAPFILIARGTGGAERAVSLLEQVRLDF